MLDMCIIRRTIHDTESVAISHIAFESRRKVFQKRITYRTN